MKLIKRYIVGQLQTNCYFTIDEKTNDTLIIDPGDDADYLIRTISDLKIIPKAIIATHGHFDHILAVTELKLAYKIPFLMCRKDEFLLTRMQTSARYFTHTKVDPPPKIDKYLKEGEKLKIGNCKLIIVSTPGHTPGSICLYLQKDKVLFCGDLVFAEGSVGRTDFIYSNTKDLDNSLAKIMRLPKKTKVLSGHGDETTIEKVKLYNIS